MHLEKPPLESEPGAASLEFAGEVWIQGASPDRIEADHMARYEFASRYVNGRRVLDIACGTGFGANYLSAAGASSVDAVDVSSRYIEYARNRFDTKNVHFTVGDICSYSSKEPYDMIVCFETIEHVENYRGALSNIWSLLADGGLLLISSPNRPITSRNALVISDKPRNKYHTQEFTIRELSQELKDARFRVNSADIWGQRKQFLFSNSHIRSLYDRWVSPNRRSSPKVTRNGRILVPRYFVILARKEAGPAGGIG
jgi:SAM-dependent methyltransferase